MAGTRKDKKRKAVTIQESQSSQEEQDESNRQCQMGASHLYMAENILSISRKGRDEKRKAIEAEHQQMVEKLEAKIESFYSERTIKLIQIQDSQWKQLGDLLKTRKSIEAAIFKNIILIEQATQNMSRELKAMFEARKDEIVEIETTSKIMEKV